MFAASKVVDRDVRGVKEESENGAAVNSYSKASKVPWPTGGESGLSRIGDLIGLRHVHGLSKRSLESMALSLPKK